jgi:hypothetical protein
MLTAILTGLTLLICASFVLKDAIKLFQKYFKKRNTHRDSDDSS